VSNGIRYDSLLVRYLAAELDERLRGRVLRAVRLDAESRAAALVFRRAVLYWDLDPAGGAVRWVEGERPADAAGVHVIEPARGTTVARVTAPPDERVLRIELAPPTAEGDAAGAGRRAASLCCVVVELMTNQWNAVALGADGRILAVLRPREAYGRVLRPGATYVEPQRSVRAGASVPLEREEWRGLLGDVSPAERERVLLARVAYTSPLNARAILGAATSAEDGEALDAAYERYRAVASLPPADPHVLRLDGGAQPYPLPLPGVPAERFPSLLDAIVAASREAAPAAAVGVSRAALERLEARVAELERRAARLREEWERSGPRAAELRRQADLLLAHPGRAVKGMTEVELPDFTGGTVRIALDPALTPVENAHRMYAAARKHERAAAQLPARIEAADQKRQRLAALLQRALAGAASAAEVEAALGPAAPGGGRRGGEARRLPPYRRYRTSGGLEVRVGRNNRANDELTFHHSSPNDVWLHAREASGAHVILRWPDPNSNPPARDLTEAAVLAALHSRARTSGTVAVDWTRRRYVRKPRKAPPGLVVPERVRTLFVVPDPAAEERLRVPDDEDEG
jgi:predicted ribosome quality control (RQC) complex YloA/Tae2 family protein